MTQDFPLSPTFPLLPSYIQLARLGSLDPFFACRCQVFLLSRSIYLLKIDPRRMGFAKSVFLSAGVHVHVHVHVQAAKRLWRLLMLDMGFLDSGESGNDLAKVGLIRTICIPSSRLLRMCRGQGNRFL